MTKKEQIINALLDLGYVESETVGLDGAKLKSFCCKHVADFYMFILPTGQVRAGRDYHSAARVSNINVDAIISASRNMMDRDSVLRRMRTANKPS